MGVFVVEGLRLNGGNVATKQYTDQIQISRLVLGPKSSGQPIADGVTQGETSWDDSGVSIWTGSLWRLLRFQTTIFELDASGLGGELGRLVTEWPSVVSPWSPLVANSMGTATPRLDEDGGVAFVRLGPEHGYFSINGFHLNSAEGHTITMVVRNHSGSLGDTATGYLIPFHFFVEAHDTGWGLFNMIRTTKNLYYSGPDYPWSDVLAGGFLGDDLIFAGMGWVVLSLVVNKEKTEVFKNGISVYSVATPSPLPPSEPHTIMTIAAHKSGGKWGCNLDVAFVSVSQGALDTTAVVDLQNNLQTRLGIW